MLAKTFKQLVKSVIYHVPSRYSKNFRQLNNASLQNLDSVLRENFFSAWSYSYLETAEGKHHLEGHLVGRLNQDRMHVIPWLGHAVDLSGLNMLEIGCGTGASTVALCEQGANVTGIDIDEASLARISHTP